jgi:hypothetical protein
MDGVLVLVWAHPLKLGRRTSTPVRAKNTLIEV